MAIIQVRFGTANLDNVVESWREDYDRRIQRFLIPRLDGGAKADVGKFGPRRIRLKCQLGDITFNALRTTFDALLKELNNGKQFLTLYDDRRIECQRNRLRYSYRVGTPLSVVDFDLDFLAEASFWEKTTLTTVTEVIAASPTTFPATNNGSAFTRPKITITADQGVSVSNIVLDNITNGDKWSYTGTIAVGKALVIDHDAGTILNDGVDDFAKFNGDLIGFLLEAGANSLKYTGQDCTIKVEFRDRYA